MGLLVASDVFLGIHDLLAGRTHLDDPLQVLDFRLSMGPAAREAGRRDSVLALGVRLPAPVRG